MITESAPLQRLCNLRTDCPDLLAFYCSAAEIAAAELAEFQQQQRQQDFNPDAPAAMKRSPSVSGRHPHARQAGLHPIQMSMHQHTASNC